MFASPVPIHRAWSAGLTARAPVDSDGWLSDSGVHFTPALLVAYTPPPAVAAYVSVPSAARAVTRPLAMPSPAPALDHIWSVKPVGSSL